MYGFLAKVALETIVALGKEATFTLLWVMGPKLPMLVALIELSKLDS